jgi:predicted nucleotidyltransferase
MDAALSVPTILNRVRIPQSAIQSVVDQIATHFNPQKIILFGSYAYGTPRPESDVDLLVILETQLSETDQASRICQSIQYRFGLDLIVCSPQRLAQRLSWGDSFLKEINHKGSVVYESPDA